MRGADLATASGAVCLGRLKLKRQGDEVQHQSAATAAATTVPTETNTNVRLARTTRATRPPVVRIEGSGVQLAKQRACSGRLNTNRPHLIGVRERLDALKCPALGVTV